MPKGIAGSGARSAVGKRPKREDRRQGVMGDWHRRKIMNSGLLSRLIRNSLGKLDPKMSQSELTSAAILMRKVMPDLASVEHKGDVGAVYVIRVPVVQDAAEWQQSIERRREGAPALIEHDPVGDSGQG